MSLEFRFSSNNKYSTPPLKSELEEDAALIKKEIQRIDNEIFTSRNLLERQKNNLTIPFGAICFINITISILMVTLDHLKKKQYELAKHL